MQAGERIGPYEVVAPLAAGGMAQVYTVRHRDLGVLRAMKVPHEHLVHDPLFVASFLRDARIAANLHHPHIVIVHDVSEKDAAQLFFTMELIEGSDLSRLLAAGRLEPKRAWAILAAVADALDYAHSRKVIHRDIKPSNILMPPRDGNGEYSPKVVDFGIARAAEEIGGERLTRTGMIVGSPLYMSPEQAGSGASIDHRTDVYSLGIVAYEMLCGTPPFSQSHGANPMSILVKHLHEAPPRPDVLNGDLPPRAAEVLLRALSKEPDKRPFSCNQFAAELKDALLVAAPSKAVAPEWAQSSAEATMPRTMPLAGVPAFAEATAPLGSSTPAAESASPEKRRAAPAWALLLGLLLLLFVPLGIGALLLGGAWNRPGARGTSPAPAPASTAPAPTAIAPTAQPVKPGAVDPGERAAAQEAQTADRLVNRVSADLEALEHKINTGKISGQGATTEALRIRKRAEQAAQHAGRAVALGAESEDVWSDWCEALYYADQYDAARQRIAEARKRFPGSNKFDPLAERLKSVNR